jgi:limonene 1,2-monooxygenase
VNPTKFGLFLSPLHAIGADPTVTLRNDLRLARHADELGFEEFWVGEHHSGGWGLVGSPEIFIAAAAEQTRQIHFGSGVVSVPYHHPFMVAERASLLSHLTRGRFTLGLGAGSAASDMYMLGIEPSDTRGRLSEGAEVITRLLRGERVTANSTWFELRDAKMQLPPHGSEMEIVIASAATPHGVALAGELGINVLSHAAAPWGNVRPGQTTGIIDRLPSQWDTFASEALRRDREPQRADWRINLPVHVAPSREEAIEEIYDGWLAMRRELWRDTMGIPMSRAAAGDRPAFEATMRETGFIAGGPADVAQSIASLAETVGGFGRMLITIQDWAPMDKIFRSVELFATEVRPRLTGSAAALRESQQWAASNKDHFQTTFSTARSDAMTSATR